MRLLLPEHRELADDDLLDLYDPGGAACVRAGFVVSVDGTAAVDGSSRPLGTAADRAAFRALRAVSDAVVVGAGTVRAEDYGPVRLRAAGRSWRAARSRPEHVPLVVVSRSLRLDPAGRWATGARPVVVTCAAADRGRRQALSAVADLLVAGEDDVDLPAAVGELASRGLRSLLCEGGPALLQAFLAASLVDELCLTVSPALAGGLPLLPGALPAPVPLRLVHAVDGGDGSLLCRWSRRD